MKIVIAALLLAGLAVSADEPSFQMWKSPEMKGWAKELAPKVKDGLYAETMNNMGNYSFMRILRVESGQAELHENVADVIVVVSGDATLVTGGTVVDGKTTAPHEIRGSGISGGMDHKLVPGDVLTVPPKMPHQVKLAPGKQIVYLTVKVAQ